MNATSDQSFTGHLVSVPMSNVDISDDSNWYDCSLVWLTRQFGAGTYLGVFYQWDREIIIPKSEKWAYFLQHNVGRDMTFNIVFKNADHRSIFILAWGGSEGCSISIELPRS